MPKSLLPGGPRAAHSLPLSVVSGERHDRRGLEISGVFGSRRTMNKLGDKFVDDLEFNARNLIKQRRLLAFVQLIEKAKQMALAMRLSFALEFGGHCAASLGCAAS